ncbi:MAG: hypothetical protein COY38_01460 [Candidatus Aenigmarchaeota archaeon CG_4_10_14_0_8_um_filter_37_24]|nr:type II toxin-antitoxin system VapC family toxin [Candidatus Aenigmarchaeota archaeon]OIN88544.1 MAG: hypothetical protein AUJ50_00725 [Candidatus Aenigmarchaeota archaeon CG1_02_38_14]PIV68887.1 MAG: hypothetical protein COS07_02810 [Candidatus Aenigmarchaeota archaeon CG01_land_8_20_14_3_00_37_9]PIW41066.1 MAG: hypothetical protein COW21_03705 [Candidatus Aenigmarchaeota archaeon CG15_BIG_FIL_POST_REV_8_21_14_020_37_27]PIX50915.1 MAG: hypothetical protein COZ52_01505 [Candidatus Aenigmarch
MSVFVDSNIYIYYFEENEEFTDKIEDFFKKNKDTATSTLVVKEICWYYEKKKEFEKMKNLINDLLKTEVKILDVTSKQILNACELKMKHKSIELNDLINYNIMKENDIETIFSSDKHFDKLPGIKRKFSL